MTRALPVDMSLAYSKNIGSDTTYICKAIIMKVPHKVFIVFYWTLFLIEANLYSA